MHGSFDKLSGDVEVDETFIGGKARNMQHPQTAGSAGITGTGTEGSQDCRDGHPQRDPVLSSVRTVVVENRKKKATTGRKSTRTSKPVLRSTPMRFYS